jgi:acetyl-CoA synthetase
MLATAKIGADPTASFALCRKALRPRDARSKVVVTCDGAWLRGRRSTSSDITDEAVNRSHRAKVIVYKRTGRMHMSPVALSGGTN